MALCKNCDIKSNFFVGDWSLACRTGNGENCFLQPSTFVKVFHLKAVNISYNTCNFINTIDRIDVTVSDKEFKW